MLGHEIDATLGVKVSESLSVYAQGAVFLPGGFYSIPVGRIAGTALGSNDPQMLWDASAGANVRF